MITSKKTQVTAATSKNIAVPRTVQEKYDKMKTKNPQLEKLREVFDLDISL